jgi:hypothetical protein
MEFHEYQLRKLQMCVLAERQRLRSEHRATIGCVGCYDTIRRRCEEQFGPRMPLSLIEITVDVPLLTRLIKVKQMDMGA